MGIFYILHTFDITSVQKSRYSRKNVHFCEFVNVT